MRVSNNMTFPMIPTGVPGLDEILHGGLIRGGFYLLQGNPGSGKTTLAVQYALECKRRGEVALYISLTESAADLERTCLSHDWDVNDITLVDLSFAQDDLDSTSENTIFYSAEVALGQLVQKVLDETERVKPQHLIFDGLSEMRLLAGEPLRYRHQMMALKQFFGDRDITTLFLDDLASPMVAMPPESLVSGNIIMERQVPLYGGTRRRIQITKMRGADFRSGYHDYDIKTGGLLVYPRLVASDYGNPFAPEEFSSGIPNLDQMMGGGLVAGTTSLLMGPSGTGKSTIAMKYVAAALERGEKAAVYTFDEVVRTLIARSEKLCYQGISQYVASGQLEVTQIDPAELTPGEFAHRVRQAIETKGIRLLVIDSITGYMNSMLDERFLAVHLHELFTYLNQRGIVTLAVVTQHGMVKMESEQLDVSYLADTILLLRHFEAQGEFLKAISAFKKRTGSHEQTLRQLSITSEGIIIGEPLQAFHGIMTGVPEYIGKTALTLDGDGSDTKNTTPSPAIAKESS